MQSCLQSACRALGPSHRGIAEGVQRDTAVEIPQHIVDPYLGACGGPCWLESSYVEASGRLSEMRGAPSVPGADLRKTPASTS